MTASLIARWAAIAPDGGDSVVRGIGYWPEDALEDAHRRGCSETVVVQMTHAAFVPVYKHGGGPSPGLRVAAPEASRVIAGVRFGVWLSQEEGA